MSKMFPFCCCSKQKKPHKRLDTDSDDLERVHFRLKSVLYEARDSNQVIKTDNLPFGKASKPLEKTVNHCIQEYISTDSLPLKNENILVDIANDRRERFSDTYRWPNSAIGLLEVIFPDGKSFSTGTVVGPSIVLTAAHNLYDNKTQKEAISVKFIPGKNEKLCPFGIHEAMNWHFPEEFKTDQNEDYAIIFLKPNIRWSPIGNYTGVYGIRCYEEGDLKKKISIKGYPMEKPKEGCHQLWGMTTIVPELITINEFGVFRHNIDTTQGQSGSGFVIEEENMIIGIHVRGNDNYNEATVITSPRLEQIKKWIMTYYISGDIENLNLMSFEMSLTGMKLLSEFPFPNLKMLCLDNNSIGPEGAKLLGRIKIPCLQELSLRKNEIGLEGVIALRNLNFSHLKKLDLYKNDIGDKGVKALCEISFSRLEWFNLEKNSIGDKGTQYLGKENKKFENLLILRVGDNNIGKSSINQLRKAFPKTTIN